MKEKFELKYDDNTVELMSCMYISYYRLGIDFWQENPYFNKKYFWELVDLYANLELDEDYQLIRPGDIGNLDVLEVSNEILISLLPSLKNAILDFDNILEFKCNEDYYISNFSYSVNPKGVINYNKIEIGGQINEYTISAINHEKGHGLVFNNINLNRVPNYLFEFFSNLLQNITAQVLKQKYSFFSSPLISDLVRVVDMQQECLMLSFLYENQIIENSFQDKAVKQYYFNRINDYFISGLFSSYLTDSYLDDSKLMIKKINQCFKNQISVLDFLDYYGVSFDSLKLYNHAKEKTDLIKKYSISF